MLEIVLEIIHKENDYDWKGEKADFTVRIESLDLIDAIDLNAIKNALAKKVIEKQQQADIEKAAKEK